MVNTKFEIIYSQYNVDKAIEDTYRKSPSIEINNSVIAEIEYRNTQQTIGLEIRNIISMGIHCDPGYE